MNITRNVREGGVDFCSLAVVEDGIADLWGIGNGVVGVVGVGVFAALGADGDDAVTWVEVAGAGCGGEGVGFYVEAHFFGVVSCWC